MRGAWRIVADRVWTGSEIGAIDGAIIDGEGGRILSITASDPRRAFEGRVTRAGLVTPALVDAHTHAAWMGHRHAEYVLRMQGADYVTIANAGGGIVRSHEAVAAASTEAIEVALVARLRRMAQRGVATVEVKSGYGLTVNGELKQLRAMKRASAHARLPRTVRTFLALHALPPGVTREEHLARMIDEVLPIVADEDLAERVDAYVDPHAFTADEALRLFEAATKRGLGCTVHAGQFGDVGGAEVAARFGAGSADHLEHLSRDGAEALARAGTRAVLLPIASYTLRQRPPPIATLRDAGVKLVVASDANPGTAPTESLPLAMALAVREYGLSVEETLRGTTVEASASLGLASGALEPGAPATLTMWDLPHENALMMPWGAPPILDVWREGTSLL